MKDRGYCIKITCIDFMYSNSLFTRSEFFSGSWSLYSNFKMKDRSQKDLIAPGVSLLFSVKNNLDT